MKNNEIQTVKYSVTIQQSTIDVLRAISEAGKNAAVLLTIASNIKQEKPLAQWAQLTFGVAHFEKLLTGNKASLTKACNSDSYHAIRTLVNIHLDGKIITVKQFEKLTDILKIQAFKENETLNAIKSAYLAALEAKDDSPLADSKAAKKVKDVEVKVTQADESNEVSIQDLIDISDKINNMNAEDCHKLMAQLQSRLAYLDQEAKKTA